MRSFQMLAMTVMLGLARCAVAGGADPFGEGNDAHADAALDGVATENDRDAQDIVPLVDGAADSDGGGGAPDGAPDASLIIAFDGGSKSDASTSCVTNATCGKGAYCEYGEGTCKGLGTCDVEPATCPPSITPVCGCDGVTYGGACDAHAAGVTVATKGSCK